jgi:hypothetical protein
MIKRPAQAGLRFLAPDFRTLPRGCAARATSRAKFPLGLRPSGLLSRARLPLGLRPSGLLSRARLPLGLRPSGLLSRARLPLGLRPSGLLLCSCKEVTKKTRQSRTSLRRTFTRSCDLMEVPRTTRSLCIEELFASLVSFLPRCATAPDVCRSSGSERISHLLPIERSERQFNLVRPSCTWNIDPLTKLCACPPKGMLCSYVVSFGDFSLHEHCAAGAARTAELAAKRRRAGCPESRKVTRSAAGRVEALL